MRAAGFLLMASGWVIVVAALFLLHSPVPRGGFALAGLAAQVLGLIFAVRSHRDVELERG